MRENEARSWEEEKRRARMETMHQLLWQEKSQLKAKTRLAIASTSNPMARKAGLCSLVGGTTAARSAHSSSAAASRLRVIQTTCPML